MREQGGPLRTAAPTRDAGPEVVGADVPIGPPYCPSWIEPHETGVRHDDQLFSSSPKIASQYRLAACSVLFSPYS